MRYIKISLNLLGNAIILRNNGFICFQLFITKLDITQKITIVNFVY